MIVCEIGQNHIGSMDLARTLIDLSKRGSADLCKFQLYDHDKLYKDTNIPNVELTFNQAKELFDYGKSIDMEVFFSVFDVEKVKWCEEIGVKRYKLANSMTDVQEYDYKPNCKMPFVVSKESRERSKKNLSVIDAIGKTKKPTIASNARHLCLYYPQILLCVSNYPATIIDYDFYNHCFCHEWGCDKEHYNGISDHTIGLDASKIALARGAEIIEKHFCLNHDTGIDAPWSMTYGDLIELKRWHDLCASVL